MLRLIFVLFVAHTSAQVLFERNPTYVRPQAQSLNLEDRIALLETSYVNTLNDFRVWHEAVRDAVMFFFDRERCPDGWHAAAHLDGRMPIVMHGNKGQISQITTSDTGVRRFETQCDSTAKCNSEGPIPVCRHTGDELPLQFNVTDVLPHFAVLACIRD